MNQVREEVPAPLDGQRIDRVVAMLTGLSRSDATALVQAGGVHVDDVAVTKRTDRIHTGQIVIIDVPEQVVPAGPEADPDVDFPVVHADDHVIVVDKPAHLVVHPGAGHHEGTLVNGLLARYPELVDVGDPARPGIVHRLDRGTSGLLMVARTQEAYEALVAQLGARTVLRRYRALAWGHPESLRGLIDAPIGRSARQPTKMAVVTDGKEARTRYEVEHQYADPVEVSVITCELETGRTHQIRVHLSAIGHPVVGDDRYNGIRQSLSCPRPFLHAERLGFDHPVTGEHLVFESVLPDDLSAVLAGLS